MRIKPNLTLLSSAVLAALSAQPVTVLAQDALEEIIVTARRRAESFQDVPVTITAFSEAEIESAGSERPRTALVKTPPGIIGSALSGADPGRPIALQGTR